MKSRFLIIAAAFAITLTAMTSSADAADWRRRFNRSWNRYENQAQRQFRQDYRSFQRNWNNRYRYSNPYRYNSRYRYRGYSPYNRSGVRFGNGNAGFYFNF